MKISLNWARFYGGIDLNSITTDQLVAKIGEQLGAVEDVIAWGPRYEGIFVARVVSCEKHHDADKLHVCIIDDGGVAKDVLRTKEGYVQVVCGAPNVRNGMTVAWIPPGITVPSTIDKDPLVLESREIRGVVSNGMLASASELGISDNHDGLLDIKAEDVGEDRTKPGTPFKNLYGLDDVVIELENKMFTHRPDCFGVLGVTRELAGITHQAFTSPEWYTATPAFADDQSLELTTSNQVQDVVPRFMTVVMNNIKIGPSPIWVQAALSRVGIKPINNVVDITNFAMQLTAQPLHAFDYDKIKAVSEKPSLGPRFAREGETLTLLGGKTIKLQTSDIVIATDKQSVALAGIMGGADTEVDDTTKTIILECATFDMYAIRRSSTHHGLFTDAAQRFTKDQSSMQNGRVLSYTMKLLGDYCGAKQASNVSDVSEPEGADNQSITLQTAFVNQRLGTKLDETELLQLLQNVEIEGRANGDSLELKVPFWRRDLELPEDIVEEVGRLHGYASLPTVLPRRSTQAAEQLGLIHTKRSIRQILSSAGANEVLTYSFVHGDLLRKLGLNVDEAYQLRNALSPQLQYIRTSLVPSLLAQVQPNQKAGFDEFGLFELNPVFSKKSVDEDGLPIEYQHLSFVYAASSKAVDGQSSAFFRAKIYLETLSRRFGIQATYRPIEVNKENSTYENQFALYEKLGQSGRFAGVFVGSTQLGVIAEPSQQAVQLLKLPKFTAFFTIDVGLMQQQQTDRFVYSPLARFPSIDRDICLKVEASVSHDELRNSIEQSLQAQEKQHGYIWKIDTIDIYELNENEKQITFRIKLRHPDRTLTDQNANAVVGIIGEVTSIAHKAVVI